MSTSDLYILNDKSVTHIAEFKNGWGVGPAAWTYLGNKYVGEHTPDLSYREYLEKVWALAHDDRLLFCEKAVLLFTFDYAYVRLENLDQMGTCCMEFAELSADGTRANHWKQIGVEMKMTTLRKQGRHVRGICLNQTSAEMLWNEKGIEKAWSIFAE